MDCIDLFKRAAMALQTDPRYLALDQARKLNDNDEELQNMIGEFNLARRDLNNEIGKSEGLREPRQLHRRHHQHRHERRRPHDRAGTQRVLHRQLLHLRRLPLSTCETENAAALCRPRFPCKSGYSLQTRADDLSHTGRSARHDVSKLR